MNILPLQSHHVDDAAQLHRDALAGDFLPSLGGAFLKILYGGMLELRLGFGHVAVDSKGHVVGFVMGTTDSRALFRQLIARRFVQFVWQVGLALLRKPTLVGRTLETFLYPSKEGRDTPGAELLVIVVCERFRGQKIGAALIEKFDEAMRARQTSRYKVTVFAKNHGANRFYQSLGFAPYSTFTMYETQWNLYVRELR